MEWGCRRMFGPVRPPDYIMKGCSSPTLDPLFIQLEEYGMTTVLGATSQGEEFSSYCWRGSALTDMFLCSRRLLGPCLPADVCGAASHARQRGGEGVPTGHSQQVRSQLRLAPHPLGRRHRHKRIVHPEVRDHRRVIVLDVRA